MPDQPIPTPSPSSEPNPVGWIAPTAPERAQQLLDAQPHLVAEKLALAWFSNADVLTHATAQQQALTSKSILATQRPAQTQAKATAIAAMRTPLTELRGVLKKKFKDAYRAYYPQFGLVQSGSDWILPVDHDVLITNLRDKLLPALVQYGFDQDTDTGTAVWQPLLDQLADAHTAALGTDSARSKAKIATDPQDAKTTKALRCLVHLVQAHFPDDWEGKLRTWGWRKTSF